MQIYVNRNRQQLGPYTEDEARKLLAEGSLHPRDWAWDDASNDWKALQDVLPDRLIEIKTPPNPSGNSAADFHLLAKEMLRKVGERDIGAEGRPPVVPPVHPSQCDFALNKGGNPIASAIPPRRDEANSEKQPSFQAPSQKSETTKETVANISRPGKYHGKLFLIGAVGVMFLLLSGWAYYAGIHTPMEAARMEEQRLQAQKILADAARGAIKLNTTPLGADVTLENSAQQKTPAEFKGLRVGKHSLQVALVGYDSIEMEVTVKGNETTDLKTLTLSRTKGSLEVKTIPGGAQFEIINPGIGKKGGSTPATLTNLPTGTYEITLKQSGYLDYKQEVTVKPNTTARITHELEKRPVMTKDEKDLAKVRGKRLFKNDDLDGAVEQYEKILKSDPNNIIVLSDLGVAQYYQGKMKEAEATLKAALNIRPKDAYCLAVLGVVNCKQGKYDDAIDVLKRSIAIQPANHEAYNFLGVTYLQKGDLEAAQEALLKAVELNSDQGEAHYNLAVLFTRQQPPSLALARRHYKKAIVLGVEKDPDLEKKLNALEKDSHG